MATDPSAIDHTEDVAVRILEPSDFDIAGDVHVALPLRVRQIVVLKLDALGLERTHHVIYIVNGPGQDRCFIRAGIARSIR